MQHWLKGISAASDPFSETFENMLRDNSGKRDGHRHVSDIAQERKTEAKESASSRKSHNHKDAHANIPQPDVAHLTKVRSTFATPSPSEFA